MWPFGLLYQSLFGVFMKSVTIENVKARIAELEGADNIIGLGLHAEFELACLRQLLALMQPAQVAEKPDLHKVIYHFRDWNEGFPVERFKADYVISWMLANYPPAPIAPVTGVDDDVRNVVALLENNEWAEHCTKTVLGSRLETEITRLVGRVQPAPVSVPDAMEMDDDFDSAFEHGKAVGWNAYRAAMLKHSEPFIVTSDHRMMEVPQVEAINAMLQGAEPSPTTDNTAQQFEALASSEDDRKLDARRRRNRQANARARAKETPEQANKRRAANRERMRAARGGKQ